VEREQKDREKEKEKERERERAKAKRSANQVILRAKRPSEPKEKPQGAKVVKIDKESGSSKNQNANPQKGTDKKKQNKEDDIGWMTISASKKTDTSNLEKRQSDLKKEKQKMQRDHERKNILQKEKKREIFQREAKIAQLVGMD